MKVLSTDNIVLEQLEEVKHSSSLNRVNSEQKATVNLTP